MECCDLEALMMLPQCWVPPHLSLRWSQDPRTLGPAGAKWAQTTQHALCRHVLTPTMHALWFCMQLPSKARGEKAIQLLPDSLSSRQLSPWDPAPGCEAARPPGGHTCGDGSWQFPPGSQVTASVRSARHLPRGKPRGSVSSVAPQTPWSGDYCPFCGLS